LQWVLRQVFIPDHPAVAIPIQNLHPVRAPVAVHQQVARKGIALDDVLGQHRQPIERAAHVTRYRAQVYLIAAGKLNILI
jgi:hypothetical protein